MDHSPLTPQQQRALRRRHKHERQAVLFGSLVAGVAHEVRNPLFGISSILDAFETRFSDRTEYLRYTNVLRDERRLSAVGNIPYGDGIESTGEAGLVHAARLRHEVPEGGAALRGEAVLRSAFEGKLL